MLVAGIVAAHWKSSFVDGVPAGSNAWLPGIAMFVAVTLGFLTCLTLPKLAPQSPDLAIDYNPFSTYIQTMQLMAKSPLLAVAGAWTFFYFIAAVVLLILPDYSAFLKVEDSETAYLMAALAVAIGVGCVIAAYADTPQRRPLFVPFGAAGLAVSFVLLGVAPADFTMTIVLLLVAGFFAGFYIIPLQSMLQALAPDDCRGRVLGTANGLSFVLGAVGSVLFLGLRRLDMPSNRIFIVLGLLCAAMAVVMLIWLKKHFARTSDEARR
jgi:sugar phosphate permease